jgi:hypothetical protein
MRVQDNRKKASQWSFTILAATPEETRRLCRLPHDKPKDVEFISFAPKIDDTGNQFIHGLIKLTSRKRVGSLRPLLGPAISSPCVRPTDILFDIGMSTTPFAAGDMEFQRNFRDIVHDFKHHAATGAFTLQQLQDSYPAVFEKNLRMALEYVDACNPINFVPTIPVTSWIGIGSPAGLPWKVYKAWLNDEHYQATHEEWVSTSRKRSANRCDRNSKAWKIYNAWLASPEKQHKMYINGYLICPKAPSNPKKEDSMVATPVPTV